MVRLFTFIFSLQLLVAAASAQDTLPRFSVVAKPNNRNVISWTNNFPYTSQISIQRSTDSTRNFKTIITVPDPLVPQNGFVDTKAAGARVFYRLFIVLDSGKYQFSRSSRPAPDTASIKDEPILQDNQRLVLSDSLSNKDVSRIQEKLKPTAPPVPKPEKFFVVNKKNTYSTVSQKNFRKFRDSIVYSTRDTLVFASVDTLIIKPFAPVEVFRASKYVYTEKYGNVLITLPEVGRKKYSVNFFEEDKRPLFEINEIKSRSLIVDKTNFVHSGWFWFELFEDGKLKERHKFFIPKDF